MSKYNYKGIIEAQKKEKIIEEYMCFSSNELVEILIDRDLEIEKLKERENMLQERFSDWKKGIEKEKKNWLCERTDCCGRIKDSKKYSNLYQENKRLNNIINEFDKWLEVNLTNLEKEETSNIYNEGLKQGMLSNGRLIKSKLQELKGSESNE